MDNSSTIAPIAPSSQGAFFFDDLRQEIGRVLVGQHDLVERMLICLLTHNHLLVEGLPGLAKTLAVRTLADALDADFSRLQFTPDLLPADVIGTNVYQPATQEFIPRKGPVFTNLLLADEINRAPAKVQSALLEAMQERQVTLGGETHQLPSPFLVMATQNPIDQEGTYALPEAQTDRFMMKVVVEYPNREEERRVLQMMSSNQTKPVAKAVTNLAEVTKAAAAVEQVHLDERIEDYILDLVLATRPDGRTQLSSRQDAGALEFLAPLLACGASPRATLVLTQGARARALLNGRDHVLPEDVKFLAPDILRHRIIPSYEAQAEELDADGIITRLLETAVTP